MSIQSIPDLFKRAMARTKERSLKPGLLGRRETGGSWTIAVEGRPGYVHVSRGPNGEDGLIVALNPNVPEVGGLPIFYEEINGEFVISSVNATSGQLRGQYGNVPPHTHSGFGGAAETLTIASGVITVTSSMGNVVVVPQSGTSDDLDKINGGTDGQTLILAPGRDGDQITVRNWQNTSGVGNIDMRGAGNNRTLLDRHDSLFLMWRAATNHWEQVGPSTLDSLVGVVITSVADGHVLTYDSTTGNWLNEAPSGSGYTDEQAQDAVGTILVDSGTIDFTYTDATPEITAIVKDASITYAKIQNISATDRLLGRATTGAGVIEEIALTAYARSLIDDVDAAAARTTLGLGTIATQAETLYALLAGRAGGQNLRGGTASGEDLTLGSTAHATKGKILFGTSGYDEATNRMGVGNSTPAANESFSRFTARDSDGLAVVISVENTGAGQAGFVLRRTGATPSRWNTTVPPSADAYAVFSGTLANYVIYLTATGRLGIGTTTPQGILHVHDGTSGMLFVTKTGIAGTEVEIMPDGTGDIAKGFLAMVVCEGSAGTTLAGSTGFIGATTPAAGSSDTTINALVTFRLYSTGRLTVFRASGAETWTVAVNLIWQ